MLVKSDIEDYIDVIDGELFWNDKIKGKRVGKPLKTEACIVSFKGVVYRYKDIKGLLNGDLNSVMSSTKPPESYHTWNAMVGRCKKNNYPISDMFSDYKTWIEWAKVQKGYKEVDIFNVPFNLDSDMFSFGVKTYSEDTCVFIPEHLNQIYKTSYKDKKELGVDFRKGSYRARIHMFNKQVIIGTYERKEDAIAAYRAKRSEYVGILLNIHRDQLEDKTVKFIEDDINNNIFI